MESSPVPAGGVRVSGPASAHIHRTVVRVVRTRQLTATGYSKKESATFNRFPRFAVGEGGEGERLPTTPLSARTGLRGGQREGGGEGGRERGMKGGEEKKKGRKRFKEKKVGMSGWSAGKTTVPTR